MRRVFALTTRGVRSAALRGLGPYRGRPGSAAAAAATLADFSSWSCSRRLSGTPLRAPSSSSPSWPVAALGAGRMSGRVCAWGLANGRALFASSSRVASDASTSGSGRKADSNGDDGEGEDDGEQADDDAAINQRGEQVTAAVFGGLALLCVGFAGYLLYSNRSVVQTIQMGNIDWTLVLFRLYRVALVELNRDAEVRRRLGAPVIGEDSTVRVVQHELLHSALFAAFGPRGRAGVTIDVEVRADSSYDVWEITAISVDYYDGAVYELPIDPERRPSILWSEILEDVQAGDLWGDKRKAGADSPDGQKLETLS